MGVSYIKNDGAIDYFVGIDYRVIGYMVKGKDIRVVCVALPNLRDSLNERLNGFTFDLGSCIRELERLMSGIKSNLPKNLPASESEMFMEWLSPLPTVYDRNALVSGRLETQHGNVTLVSAGLTKIIYKPINQRAVYLNDELVAAVTYRPNAEAQLNDNITARQIHYDLESRFGALKSIGGLVESLDDFKKAIVTKSETKSKPPLAKPAFAQT